MDANNIPENFNKMKIVQSKAKLKSSIECQKCFFKSSRFQTELCLHLPVPTDDKIVVQVHLYDQEKQSVSEHKVSVPNKGMVFRTSQSSSVSESRVASFWR